MGTLMPPHPLTNFEIQKYYQNEPIFNGVYSRDNLPKKIINLVKYLDICFVKEEKLFISIDLVLNMFLKKSKNLSGKKNQSQYFSSTSKQFDDVWVLLHGIHWFCAWG